MRATCAFSKCVASNATSTPRWCGRTFVGKKGDRKPPIGFARSAGRPSRSAGSPKWSRTAGVDVQADRLEIAFVGHGKEATFLLGNTVVWGRPEDDTSWAELDEILKTTWRHPNGGTLKIDAAAIDSGDGNRVDLVNAFTRPRFSRKVVSIKGVQGFTRPPIEKSHSRGSLLFIVGVDGVKQRVQAGIAHGSIRLSANLETRAFEELCSERLVVRYLRGQPARMWQRVPGRRAEILDAVVYALAVRGIVNVPLETRAAELSSPAAPKSTIPSVIPSKWLTR